MPVAPRNSSYKLQGLVTLLCRYRISPAPAAAGSSSFATKGYRRDSFFIPHYYLGYGHNNNCMNQGLRSFSTRSTKEAAENPHFDVAKDGDKKTQPTMLPVSNKQGFSAWAKWLLGSFLTLLLPFLKQRLEGLRGLEGNAEKIVEEVEVVAEMVENVATVAKKASSEMAEKLPDNTKIKQAVLAVEHISSVTAQEAQLTQAFIHQVGEMKQDLEEMKTIAEPIIHKIVEPQQQIN